MSKIVINGETVELAAQSVEIEEYDSVADGCEWHIVKYPNGLCQLFGVKNYTNIPITRLWGNEYIDDNSIVLGSLKLPLKLSKRYIEYSQFEGGKTGEFNVGVVTMVGSQMEPETTNILRILRPVETTLTTINLDIFIVGRWK